MLCITGVVAWVTPRIKNGQWLVAVILVSLFVTFARERYFFLNSPNIRWMGQIVLSEPARKEWLVERNLVSAELFEMKGWMDRAVPMEDELYGYRVGYLFYFDRKNIVSDAHFKEQIDVWLQTGPDYAAQRLYDLNVGWFLTNVDNWQTRDPEVQDAWTEFHHKYLDPVRHIGVIHLFRLLSKEESVPWHGTIPSTNELQP